MDDDRLMHAIVFAAEAHGMQTDKVGMPYMLHVLRVCKRVRGVDLKIVAALHDVVEDTPVTLSEISRAYGMDVRYAVDALTRREGERYFDYIERVGAHSFARAVKIADLHDNLSRIEGLGASGDGLRRRYERALGMLTA